MLDWLGFLQLRVRSLNWKLIICVVRSRIQSQFTGLTQRGQKLRTTLWLDLVGFTDTTVRRVKPNVLPESNINNFFCGKSLIFLEINFSGEAVVFEELEERIDFERKALLWLWEQYFLSTQTSIFELLKPAIDLLIDSIFLLLGDGYFAAGGCPDQIEELFVWLFGDGSGVEGIDIEEVFEHVWGVSLILNELNYLYKVKKMEILDWII